MITRYSRDEMVAVWAPEKRFEWMLKVEQAVAQAQGESGLIPKDAAQEIASKSKINLARILELESTTKHDVIAFVSQVAETLGPAGRYVHFGLTSSDVLDTALSLQIDKAFSVLLEQIKKLQLELAKSVRTYASTICVGRTHGIHAEPTTFGYKLLGFLAESKRVQNELMQAREDIKIGKISGAVGTYSALSPTLETRVCEILGLKPEEVATQVVPRDRHGRVMVALGFWGSFIERLATELRHLQRTEVAEVIENFTPGQKGSSAMPHKKNPISGENLTGLARLLRSYVVPALENIALWHERDISHSSVERVILPDAFIVADYATTRMRDLIAGLYVNQEQMKSNLQQTGGHVFSSHVLLLLVDKGLSREEAYKVVQSLAHDMKPGEHLRERLLTDPRVKDRVQSQELDAIFSGQKHLQHVPTLINNKLNQWGFSA